MMQTSRGPRVTVIVTHRDRLSAVEESLSSLIENTPEPFELVLAMGPLPKRLKDWVEARTRDCAVRFVDTARPMTPAEARNEGLRIATTEYVAFVENDVVFEKGWLGALIACADETGAELVAPLTCEGRPIHTIVHHVGCVESNQDSFEDARQGARDFTEEFYLQGRTREEASPLLVRRRTRSFEMHCFLARRAVFDRVGVFDPDVVSKEYLDFAWRVLEAGGSIWLEPTAVVTFLVPSRTDPVRFGDLSYFLLRWSHAWQVRSHDVLKAKWGFKEDGFIAKRRALSKWRIVEHVAKPAIEDVPVLGRRWGFVSRASQILYCPLAAAAGVLAWRYRRLRGGAVKRELDAAF